MGFHYIYVIQSLKDNHWYTGFTSNLHKRIKEHEEGVVRSTAHRRPFKLIYLEACLNKTDALAREKYLKTGMGKRFLRNRLKHFLENL